MYNQFFGLQRDPFSLTPNPEFLYLTPQHREALAGFTYAILARKGFVILSGDAGTGKTTLLMRALQHLPEARVRSSLIVNPTLSAAEFLESTLLGFGFKDIPASKALRIQSLQGFLGQGHNEGRISALIVDEAHKLSLEVLEEVRLLGNFETADQKLLQVILVGQSELDGLLDCEQLRQFKQRIALRVEIKPLLPNEVPEYIRRRWTQAGGSEPPFSPAALAGIRQASQGVPRVINVLCDNALIQACADGSASVEGRHVAGACRDLHLDANVPAEAPPPAPPLLPQAAAGDFYRMKTLERYSSAARRPSLAARVAARLGILQRTEIA